MTRVDSQCNTTGDCVPRQPAPRLPPSGLILQNSWDQTCRSLRWTCSVATALLQRFPCWISKVCQDHLSPPNFTVKGLKSLWFCPLPISLKQSNTPCWDARDGLTHTNTLRPQSYLGWTAGRPAYTHFVQWGLHTVIKKEGGDYCTVASSCLWRLSDWSAEQSPALTSPKAILQFC